VAIQSWKSKQAKAVFEGRNPGKGFPTDLIAVTRRRLMRIDAAQVVTDLRVPPGHSLEQLVGERSGEWSIRVNDQFRLCFVWAPRGPADVECVDYH